MSITLDSALQTVMDGNERRPLAQILSTSFYNKIPFVGHHFGESNSSRGLDPDLKSFSTGELVTVTIDDSAWTTIRLMLTDTSREQWSVYDFSTGSQLGASYGATCCEMPSGNIAVAWRYSAYGTYYIRVTSVTKTGTRGTVYTAVSGSYTIYNPYIIYNDNVSKYQLFYTTYDGSSTYRMYMVESSNLSSWDTPVDITPSSFGTAKKYNNVHALIISDDDIVLSFDYTDYLDPVSGFELTNVYYIVSTDNGSTWNTPTAVTTYSAIGKGARHPSLAEKTSGNLYFTFHDRETFVIFDKSTDGVLSDCGSHICSQDLHMYNGYLYVTGATTSIGYKNVCGLYIVDPTDMSMVAQYTSNTVPGYSQLFADTHSWWHRSWSDGKYLMRFVGGARTCYQGVSGSIGNSGVIFVVSNDLATESTTTYVIGNGCDVTAYSLDENVALEPPTCCGYSWVNIWGLTFAWIDADSDRLYCWFGARYLYAQESMYGFIDLTESPDPVSGYYTFTEIYRKSDSTLSSSYGLGGCNLNGCQSFGYGRYCKEDDVIVVCHGDDTSWDQNTAVMVLDAKTGVIQFCANYTSDRNIPYNGLRSAYVYDQKIYGCFLYDSLHGQEEWRGLWIYDMVTGTKQTIRPGYATKDQYYFYDYDFGDIGNNYIWIGSSDGALRYHIGNQSFERFSNTELPGFDMGDNSTVHYIEWDPVGEDVYCSKMNSYAQNWTGVRRFNINGDYRKGQYLQGSKTGTNLNLANQQDLTRGYYEADIVSAVDAGDVMWSVWDHIDNVDNDRDFYWDNDESETDVSDDLTDVVEIAWDIEVPTEVRFSLANGQKYDQQNSLSTLSYLFRRGRKVVPKFGENIGGTSYWVQQGVFIVEEASITYNKNDHPVFEVVARDISSLWQDARVVLTDFYDSQTPKYILDEILSDWTVLETSDYDIPTFATSHTIWNQWQDETLYDIIKSILDHFEYVFYFDTDGIFTPKRLEFDKAVDHTYSNQVQIRGYTPDTSFSSFVNQIRVIGETHDFIEIVYDPEEVGSVNGTCGWWDETINHTVWYNKEHTRKIRNPYLSVNISAGDFTYFLAKFGGAEYISYEDPQELYCIVTVEGPNLIPVVVGLAAILLALGFAALGCDGFISGVCGFYINAALINVNLLCMALLANATYDMTVWGMPLGKQKQTIQYIAIDQSQMDIVNQQPVIEEIEDPLCYEVAQCQRVAEFELNVIKYQRERVKLEKIAHLQDEIHDMIVVNHPFSGQPMQILVANLVRTLVIRGEMTDRIEGWRIA